MRMTRKRHRQQERKRLRQATITNVLSHVKSLAAVTAMLAVLTTGETYALPQDGTVVGGNATILQNGNGMTIQQMTDKVAINWQSFNIGANEKVAFYQPTSQSVALNRIVGNNASTIYGQLSANGKVYLINPNGILFAPGSEVNVGGLLASTKDISNGDFFQGNYSFGGGAATGAIVNQGTLTAKDGGYIVLIGDQVTNSGTISANGGTVAMAAGGKVLLDAPGDGLINLVVSQPQVDAAVRNSGVIQADGGKVLLTGQAGGDMLFSVINNSGMISAKNVQQKNGVIILDGGTNGTVEVSGTLDVSGQQGGTVKVLGDTVKLLSGAKVDASGMNSGGEVLIGGNWQGAGAEAHAASVLVEKGAAIQADALQNGDGGKIVLWSDEQTQFHGTITAKGGAIGGNGGMVETSGKDYLAADGSVNVSAASGKGGTWLLDPRNITIQAAGTNYSDPSYVPNSDNATVNVTSINTALNGGSNVVITTGTTGTQDGNITVAANITKTTGAEATLTLSAANNIIVKDNIGITSTNGKLNVNLDADHDGQYSGIIQMQRGSSIVTNGGNIVMYGQGDAVKGYARSATTATEGIQLQGTTLNAGGGNITLRGENTATVSGVSKGTAISLTGSGNKLLTSGSGIISLIGKAGENGIQVTDTSAQFSAGSGSIVMTADRMALAGKIGGQSGDNGTLTLQPFSAGTSIGVGGGAGILQLNDDVFSSVIQSSLSKVTIGRSDLTAAINIGEVTFRNNMNFLATGTTPATGAAGQITINGDILNNGKAISFNSTQGTNTDKKITAETLELLGSNASYALTNTGNSVKTLAADAKTLTYNGGTVIIGTAGSTSGLNLSGAGTVSTGAGSLTVSKNINTDGNLALSGKNVTVSSGAAIAAMNDTISLTAGPNGMLTINGSIDSNGGAITLTGPSTILNTNSAIASGGGIISVKSTGDVQLKGTGISTDGGALTIEGSSITATGTNNIDGGSGMMTFTADTMNLPVGTLKVVGSGITNVQSLSPSRMIDVGDGFNPDASHLQLAGQLFTANGAFGSASFSMLNIGRSDGSSTLNVGNQLSFAAPTTLRTGDNGSISLSTFAAINNAATNQALTFETGTLSSAEGAAVTSGSGLLTLSANKLILSDNSGISTGNSGRLLIKPKTATDTVGLGTATGNLQITDSVFANVFRTGFSDITVQGSSITAGALTSVQDNLTLQSTAGTITLNGDLKVADSKTITLEAKTGAMQSGGAIMTDGLQLLGSGAVYTLEQSTNQVGKLAANTGSVSFKGKNVTVDTVTNIDHGSIVGISATGNVTLESAADTTLVQNASISSGGDITLTADTMAFNNGHLSGSGKLKLQPLDPSRPIDIGSFSVNSGHLQLGSNLFSGGAAGIQYGFDSVTIGRDNGAGLISVAGTLSFANPTFIQSPTTSGSIVFQSDANIASAKDLRLTAGTVTAAAGARITGNGDIYLTADAMSLGDGNTAGSTFASSGGTLYLRPLLHSTYIDLGSNLTPAANHLQFSDTMFNGDNKVFSGFSKYTIGGTVTNTVKVDGTAHFAGNLEIQSPTLHITAQGNLDPTGKVVLRNDAMIFDDGAKVTGSGDLTLTPYTDGHSMVIGTITGAPAGALTIDGSTFTGMGRTGGAVFTGNYDGTLTFGDAAVAKDITITNMNFDPLGQPSNAFKDVKNLQILAQEAGTATINNSVLTVNKDIAVQAGTIATGTGTTITSTSGDITLTGHTLELNSGENTIRGAGNLYLRPYNASDSIAVGDNGQTAKLNLSQTLFYNTAVGSNGALGNGFSHITIGREDGSGTVQIKNAAFQNDLTVLSPSGSILLTGDLSDTGKNITLNAADIKQTNGIVTANGLELLGGTAEFTKANQVDVLAAKTNALTFRNGKALTIGTVNATTGVTTTGKTDIGSTAELIANKAVSSTGDILLSGTAMALNNNITTGSGDITLTGDTMTVSNEAKVSGNGQLKLQTLDASKNIGFGGTSNSSLELTSEWFSGTDRVFQDGFKMITIGHDNGSGTVTVDKAVTFTDAVTLQATAGGKVVIASDGFIDNSKTDQNITLKGAAIETQPDSQLNGGSGVVTLQGDSMNFSGGSITGKGHLVIKPLVDSTAITVSGSGSGLLLDAAKFNGAVIANDFADITIGSQQQSGAIAVNDFTVGTNLELLSMASGGAVTMNGTVSTTGKNLTVKAHGDINGANGILSNVDTLSADSTTGGIIFSNIANTISQLGTVTAAKGISVFNNQALTLTGNITGNTLGTAGTANSILVRAKGDLTLSGDVLVKTQGGADIYLTAENKGSQFFNDSSKGAQAISAGGRWLIYSHSPLATNAGAEPAATNRYNGLSSDFRRYNVTYDSAGPGNTMLVPVGENGFLYEYQPILIIKEATRVYGDGNTTIKFIYDGLLEGDTVADLLLTGAPNLDYGINAEINEKSAAGSIYWGTSNPYILNFTEDTVTEDGTHTSQYSLQGYKIVDKSLIPLTITKRPITITANNVTKTYDGLTNNKNTTADYSGSVATGDTLTIGLSGEYTTTPDAGTYTITATPTVTGNPGDNYQITTNNGTYIINKAPLTVTVGNQEKTYGDANPTSPTPVVTGFVNGETAASLSNGYYTAPTSAHTALWNSTVGDYAINTLGGSAKNYDFTYVPGKLTINKRAITVTADSQKKTYGENDPIFTYQDTVPDGLVKLTGSLTREAGQDVKAGGYAITQGTLGNSNYIISFTSGTLTIDPANLVISAKAGSKTYGDQDPELMYQTEGLVKNTSIGIDDSAGLIGHLSRGEGENAGAYKINRGTVELKESLKNNYIVKYKDNDFTINKANLLITANDVSRTYGDNNPALTAAFSGLKNGDSQTVVSGLQLSTTAGITSNVGAYDIIAANGQAQNYNINYINGELTIAPRHITVISDANQTKVYGQNNPSAYTYSTTNMVNGDTLSGALGRAAGENAGTYSFNLGSLNNSNYTIDSLSGPGFVITPATLTIGADYAHKVYGTNDPEELTYQAAGFVNNASLGINDSAALLTGKLSRSSGENVGEYNINQNTLSAGNNYTINYTGNKLDITPAKLFVKATGDTKVYGNLDPSLTYQATGFVNNDSLGINDSAALLTGDLSRSSGENVGSYSINQNTLSAGSNYAIEYTGNKLAITPAKLVIKANTGSKTYGDEDPTLTYQATGLVKNAALGIDDSAGLNGQLSRNTGENAGNYQINQGTVDLTTAQLKSNYDVSYESNLFTINKADLTITANNGSRIYGDSNPELTALYNGLKNGDSQNVISGLQLATSAGVTSNVGSYDIIAANGQAQNYNITYVNGKLVITPATLTYVADPRERTVGQDNPGFTGYVTGFKNQDNLSSSTTGVTVFNSPATKDSPTGFYAINGEGLTANYGNYVFEQAPGNATALNIKGLNPPGQGAVDNTHGYHPTPPTTPGGTVGGGSAVNIGFNGNGAVTVGLANDNNDIGDLTPRKEGISLPVFTRDSSGVSPEGLYDVSYNQTRLTVLPSGQNVPPAPLISSSNTPYAPFDIKIGDSTVSFSVQEVNGVVLVTPLTDEAKQVLQKNDKNNNKLILANALLTAINELSVVPDQLLAVLLATE